MKEKNQIFVFAFCSTARILTDIEILKCAQKTHYCALDVVKMILSTILNSNKIWQNLTQLDSKNKGLKSQVFNSKKQLNHISDNFFKIQPPKMAQIGQNVWTFQKITFYIHEGCVILGLCPSTVGYGAITTKCEFSYVTCPNFLKLAQ